MSRPRKLSPDSNLEAMPTTHARQIKNQLFTDEDVAQLSPLARLLWIALWTVSDKNGVFRWRPMTLKTQTLPFNGDDKEFAGWLDELVRGRFIEKFNVAGRDYGHTRTWSRHQYINKKEMEARFCYPAPPSQFSEGVDVKSPVLERAGMVQAQSAHVQERAGTVLEPFLETGTGTGVGVGVGSGTGTGSGAGASTGSSASGCTVAVDSKPKAISHPPKSVSESAPTATTGGHDKTADAIAVIQALCFKLIGKTPKADHVRSLLDRFDAGDVELTFRKYVEGLAAKDKPWAEKVFFQDGGGVGVLLELAQQRWGFMLQRVENDPNYPLENFLFNYPAPLGMDEDEVSDRLDKAKQHQHKLRGAKCPHCSSTDLIADGSAWNCGGCGTEGIIPEKPKPAAPAVETEPAGNKISTSLSESEQAEAIRRILGAKP
jgi:hypothetical protein